MKKRTFYSGLLALTLGIMLYSTTKSYASGGTKLIVRIECANAQGQTVATGNECVSGDSACIENGCPKGTCQL